MATDILTEFKSVIPANRRPSGTGWLNFCCPACGDRRYRGGVYFTPSGGFRYSCFNGGCEFNTQPTGWEPGNGFGGRPRRLFELMGGDIRRIPLKELMRWNAKQYSTTGEIEGDDGELDVVYTFPEVKLPSDTQPLFDVYQTDYRANKVAKYVAERIGPIGKNLPLFWSPEHPYHLIIPYKHYRNKVVGYLGRHIYRKSGGKRFIQRAPNDYIFNQHIVSTHTARYLFVVESPLEALMLRCLGVRNDRLTERQVNLLKVSGKDIVLIPDQKKGEWEAFYQTAVDNDWYIAVPEWKGHVSDITDSVKVYGLLYTLESIMNATTKNYTLAKQQLKAHDGRASRLH